MSHVLLLCGCNGSNKWDIEMEACRYTTGGITKVLNESAGRVGESRRSPSMNRTGMSSLVSF